MAVRCGSSSRGGRARCGPTAAVGQMLETERTCGMHRVDVLRATAGPCGATCKSELVALLTQLKRERRRIAAYGASAKGSTLLNYFGLGRRRSTTSWTAAA